MLTKAEVIRLIRQAQRERDRRKADLLWAEIQKVLVAEFNSCDYRLVEGSDPRPEDVDDGKEPSGG